MVDITRKQHWEHAYETKASDAVSWYQRRPDVSLSMIRDAGLPLEAPLIDVGGGASTLIDALLDEGRDDLSVLDISSAALSTAQERLGSLASRVDWIVADVLGFAPSKRYALWHDRAVFHFLVDAHDRKLYLETLQRSLLPDGQMVIATFAEDGPESCSGLPVARYGVASLQAIFGAAFGLVESTRETHHTPGGAEQHFTYARLQRI
ncbi:Nodulation protein S (NodS) [Dyella sp. OK004]|uniref:class I SAM-dependent methyltransferase n=1 Tax=Dyella sp. OK004 TaxID=1855292 RepID=UPI0008DEF850|nr:class I SAM-dependent methyltransferase [Dyella sp. OK004]SFR93355.1 Nodulation protein S (NodS) [Dyella sp. OK004]